MKNIKLFVLSLLLFCLPLSLSFAEEVTQLPQTITLTQAQYSRLKAIMTEQEMKLDMLEENLQTLQMDSTEQYKELTALKTELLLTKEQLSRAEISLQTAENLLKKNEEYLQKLKKQIDHKMKVKDRQRDLAWAVAGIIGVWGITK